MQKKVLGKFEEVVGLLQDLNSEGLILIGNLTLLLDDQVFCQKLQNEIGYRIGIIRTDKGYLFRRVENP